ncbi:MAG: hypothetical protein H7145_14560 [Akkermansiaceae bacterium]|nr:hypothetical protein [Armatimonadota bacterium]
MPRCQRTFRYLGDGTVTFGAGTGTWTCPNCPDHETYTTVRDADLLAYATFAQNAGIAEFGTPADVKRPVVLLWGMRPECVYEPTDRHYEIYLAAGSDPWQARLQMGHEIFHRVAGEGKVFHWTHEMLACLFSVRLLKRSGLADYAEQITAQYDIEAENCPLSTLLRADPWREAAYPPGYYGRAFVTGVALKNVVGYPALCRLARTHGPAGMPDVAAWLAPLPPAEQNAIESVLR